MNLDSSRFTWLLLAAFGATACAAGDAEEAPVLDQAPAEVGVEAGSAEEASGPGPYTAISSGGTEVELEAIELSGMHLEVGSVRWQVEVSELPEGASPTVDLVSPGMPMHGVVRHGTVSVAPGVWEFETEIAMEGEWILYVNLDEGANAAEFPVRVGAGAAGAAPNHEAMGH